MSNQKEHKKAYNCEYYRKNKEKILKQKRQYLSRPEIKEKMKLYFKNYYQQTDVRARLRMYQKKYNAKKNRQS